MPLPTNRKDLEAAGYRQEPAGNHHCRACGAPIEWWTTPNSKHMPFITKTVDGIEQLIPHWSDCPKAIEFRRPK
jgi:hypothetical protein